jgi:hypothetical protein
MNVFASRLFTRTGAILQLLLLFLLKLSMVLSISETTAIEPQDSIHYHRTLPMLAGEDIHGGLVANQKIWYTTGNKVRARNFDGEVVFEHIIEERFGTIYYGGNSSYPSSLSVSKEGRIYYTYQAQQSQLGYRVAIVAPDGTRLGDFGPTGKTGVGFDWFVTMTVSSATGNIYINPPGSKFQKGLIQVFDRDGNYLYNFITTGILADSIESPITKLFVREDAQGQDELFVWEFEAGWYAGTYMPFVSNMKVFGGDGKFRRLVTGGRFDKAQGRQFPGQFFLYNGMLAITDDSNRGDLQLFPATVTNGNETLGKFALPNQVIGADDAGRWITVPYQQGKFEVYSYPNYSNFDAVARNAAPNPWVTGVSQRPGGGIVDIDYRVDDSNDTAVTTALVGFAGGTASLNNVLPINTVLEGTNTRVGANQPTGVVQRITWNAGVDWNVDFGTLRVMALARDSRSYWFDVHLVEIPADGVRPAVTISRIPLSEPEFLAQFLWLVATKDPSVKLIDGVLFGTTGPDDGVILATGATSTPAGRTFLLKRDGLRMATQAEVTRAREGATPGFEVRLEPPLRMKRQINQGGTSPQYINEFGVESGDLGTAWYVVRAGGA